jgi:dihydroorotase
MKSLLIKNGHVVDPANGRDEPLDVYIRNGIIKEVGKRVRAKADETLDAKGLYVVPGLIDMHAHLREPGREDEETIASGTRAAAAGGFTSVCVMPNTTPVIDSQTGIKYIINRAQTEGVVNVYPIAAITKNRQGEEINEFGDLITHGAIAFSDDGLPVMNSDIMRRALEYTAMFGVPILDHCEDLNLSEGGVINEGYTSTILGLKGIPSSAESTVVARDIELAEFTGGRVHICHVSTKPSIDLIRLAKSQGIRITAEVTPHHLTLTEESVRQMNFNTNTKVKPPLCSETDRQSLVNALLSGTIDVIATDHAPHTNIEKDKVYTEAPFGLIGLETAIPVLLTELVHPGIIPLALMIEKMTISPARILKLERGTLSAGSPADVTLISPNKQWIISAKRFFSKSANSPFLGKRVKGAVEGTIVGGQLIYYRGKMLV